MLYLLTCPSGRFNSKPFIRELLSTESFGTSGFLVFFLFGSVGLPLVFASHFFGRYFINNDSERRGSIAPPVFSGISSSNSSRITLFVWRLPMLFFFILLWFASLLVEQSAPLLAFFSFRELVVKWNFDFSLVRARDPVPVYRLLFRTWFSTYFGDRVEAIHLGRRYCFSCRNLLLLSLHWTPPPAPSRNIDPPFPSGASTSFPKLKPGLSFLLFLPDLSFSALDFFPL